MFGIALTNAYILWKAAHKGERKWVGTHEEFMLCIHLYLMTQDVDVLDQPVPISKADHQQIMGRDEGWHQTQPRCNVCYLRSDKDAAGSFLKVNTRTWSYCSECQIPLCCASTGRTCFNTWHNEEEMRKLRSSKKKNKEARREDKLKRVPRPRESPSSSSGGSRASKDHRKK